MRNNPVPALVTGFLLTVFALAPTGTRAVAADQPAQVATVAPRA